jgi:hypothetical protein
LTQITKSDQLPPIQDILEKIQSDMLAFLIEPKYVQFAPTKNAKERPRSSSIITVDDEKADKENEFLHQKEKSRHKLQKA